MLSSMDCVTDREASQLDTIETSAPAPLPASYLDYRLKHDYPEYCRAIDLYCHLDSIEGTKRAERLVNCRKFSWFAYHIDTHEVRVISNACRLRWCPVCAQSRYASIRHSVKNWTLSIRSPKMFTLTLRHDDSPLGDKIKTLYNRFRLFRQHKAIQSKVRGGIWFFQLKRSSRTNDWHPHLHCILDADYISKFTLSEEWRLTTGTSFIVDIRRIKDPEKVSDYVSRYCARPGRLIDFSREDGLEMFSVLHGKRLCGSFGSGRAIQLRPQKCSDSDKWLRLIDWSDCVANINYGGAYRATFKSFATGQPLDERYVLELVPHYAKTLGLSPVTPLVIEDKQLRFKEFR